MLLAIDTATKWTSLALYDGAAVIVEHGWRSVNTHTVELAPAVEQMLRQAGTNTESVQGIAVALGPGSYTGLRIGLGFAKGLVLANQVPLIGVPTLDILAAALPKIEGQLVVVAEAGRKRISVGHYRWQGKKGWKADELPINETWDQLLDALQPHATVAGEVSPHASKKIRAAGKGITVLSPASSVRRAGYLAEIAWGRLRRGQVDDPAGLIPLYLREP